MHILYLTYDGLTDNLGQSQIIPYLKGLSELSHKITIISFEKDFGFHEFGNKIKKQLSAADIEWLPVRYTKTPPLFSTLYDIYKLQKAVKKKLKVNSCTIIHCRSYITSIIGLWAKKKYETKLIFDMRGFWADERIDGGIWNLKNFIYKRIYKFFKKKEIEFLSNADYIISLTQNAKDEILSWSQFRNNPLPIEVIPCCVDLTLFSPSGIKKTEQESLKKKLNINNDNLVISYLGSIGTWYMLDEMLDFFNCLRSKSPKAKFLFITPDNKDAIISKARKKKIPEEKLIVVSASRNEVPLYLSISNISMYFIKPAYSKKASSPTKTAEIMAMGIPIITNSGIGDSDKIISDSLSGLLINDFTNNEYIRIINQIDTLLHFDPAKIRESSQKYFSLEQGVALYGSVYRKIILSIPQQ